MKDEKILLTVDQAKNLLAKSRLIHTFRSIGFVLFGCDWSRQSILKALKANASRIEIGGEQCKKLGHGLVVWTSETDPLFIEVDKEKLQQLEDSLMKINP